MLENEDKPIQREFTNNGKTYIYDFNYLTVEQAEIAVTIGEFKLHQMEKGFPDTIDQLLRSRGAEYITLISSYLFVPYKNKNPDKFNPAKIRDTEMFLKSLLSGEKVFDNIIGCINDFFLNIGRPELQSTTKYNGSKNSGIEMLLPLLTRLGTTQANSKPLQDVTDVLI